MEKKPKQSSRLRSKPAPLRESSQPAEFPVAPTSQVTRAVLTVADLTERIKYQLETGFTDIWVEGEISNFKVSGNGHAFFSLKDENAVIRAVIWANSFRTMRLQLKEGLKVLAHGRLSVYAPSGDYRLVIDRIEISGRGLLQQQFEELKQKLNAEGLFDKSRKKPLPMLPQRIGIVTSPTGAALRDIFNILYRRFPNMQTIIAPVQVQGSLAGGQIAEGIQLLNQLSPAVDVIIVARGGGSLEDLWPFNEEIVARAVAASRIPIISGVGHEVDTTICDYVADLRAPTPSGAAEIVVRKKSEFEAEINGYRESLLTEIEHKLKILRQDWEELTRRPAIKQPERLLDARRQRVNDLDESSRKSIRHSLEMTQAEIRQMYTSLQKHSPENKLQLWKERVLKLAEKNLALTRNRIQAHKADLENRTLNLFANSPAKKITEFHRQNEYLVQQLTDRTQNQWNRQRQYFAAFLGRLNALSPLAVLERGYSIISLEKNGKILRRASEAAPGDTLSIRLHQGSIKANVTKIDPEEDSHG
jgi:exodeoxyribonuclease VII large subunit